MTKTLHYIRLILKILAILLAVGIFACSKSPSDKAQEFIDAGMYEQAKVVLSNAIEASPKNSKLHFMLGRCLLATRDIGQAQESFDRATRLDAEYGVMIGKAYYDEAVAVSSAENREVLFSLSARYDPSIKNAIAEVYMNDAIGKIDGPVDVTARLTTAAVSYNPAVAKQISVAILNKASQLPSSNWSFSHLEALSVLAARLDPSANVAWAKLFFEKMSSQAVKDSPTSLSIGAAAAARDASLREKIAHFYMESAHAALSGSPQELSIATTFFSAATKLNPSLNPRVAEIVWARLDATLANLKALGTKGFSDLFTLCEESGVSQVVRNSGRYRLAQALKDWAEGRRTSAVEQLSKMASSEEDSFEAKTARQILAPPVIGKRSAQKTPFHFGTWCFGPGGGQGVDIQLISYDIQHDQISLSFSVKSGDHKDLLLYAPRNVNERFGSNCEALYILDDNGQKFYSTSGWRGGLQSQFNSCTMAIKFDPNEEVILTAHFPMVSRGATFIKFVSPNPDNGGHQSEWYWKGISLKSGPFE